MQRVANDKTGEYDLGLDEALEIVREVAKHSTDNVFSENAHDQMTTKVVDYVKGKGKLGELSRAKESGTGDGQQSTSMDIA